MSPILTASSPASRIRSRSELPYWTRRYRSTASFLSISDDPFTHAEHLQKRAICKIDIARIKSLAFGFGMYTLLIDPPREYLQDVQVNRMKRLGLVSRVNHSRIAWAEVTHQNQFGIHAVLGISSLRQDERDFFFSVALGQAGPVWVERGRDVPRRRWGKWGQRLEARPRTSELCR